MWESSGGLLDSEPGGEEKREETVASWKMILSHADSAPKKDQAVPSNTQAQAQIALA